MTRLDDLLGQLTIDVPEAPTVDELRSRAGNRHRRPVPMVAALICVVVISVVLVQLIANARTRDEHTMEWATLAPGPRSVEISVNAPGNLLIRTSQFDLARWDWISEDFPTLGIRVNVTSRAVLPIRLTPPTWERVTADGVRYLGNEACNDNYVCMVDTDAVTLLPGAVKTYWVFVQPRLTAIGEYSFTTQFEYEVPSTGERGWIPVNVALRIWVPEPGTEPNPDTVSTIDMPPATTSVPTSSTTSVPASSTTSVPSPSTTP